MWISMFFESFYDTKNASSRVGSHATNALDTEEIVVVNSKKKIWMTGYILDIVNWQKFIK